MYTAAWSNVQIERDAKGDFPTNVPARFHSRMMVFQANVPDLLSKKVGDDLIRLQFKDLG